MIKATLALFAATAFATLPSGAANEEEDKSALLPPVHGVSPDNPHSRPPRDVPLVIFEDTQLLAADADDGHDEEDDYAPILFERLQAQFPDRFTWNEDEEHWVDARGEYTWDDENECYWQTVTAERLTRGRQDYVQLCASCHGFDGDGYGRSGQALRPPPRDFRQGLFKFTKVDSEKLPEDDALVQLVQEGLNGTPMLPWDIHENRIRDIVVYIKSLSLPELLDEDGEIEEDATGWRDPYGQIGVMVAADDDPWAGRETEAIAAGEAYYHNYQCYNCHPGYATTARMNELGGKDPSYTYRDGITLPKVVEDSSYEVLGYAVSIIPPDFTWHSMRRGETVADVYKTIAAGVGGAGMPTWKGSVPDEEIWAISYYVRHLTDTYKDKSATRMQFMRDVKAGH